LVEVENGKQVWTAKNVPNDFLDMPVPGTSHHCHHGSVSLTHTHTHRVDAASTVWVSDLGFLPDDPRRIAVVTGYHQIRVYDVK
jgi:hypothetical protein